MEVRGVFSSCDTVEISPLLTSSSLRTPGHIRENESNADEASLLVQYGHRLGQEEMFLSILENLNGRVICFQADGTHFTACAFKEFAYLFIFTD